MTSLASFISTAGQASVVVSYRVLFLYRMRGEFDHILDNQPTNIIYLQDTREQKRSLYSLIERDHSIQGVQRTHSLLALNSLFLCSIQANYNRTCRYSIDKVIRCTQPLLGRFDASSTSVIRHTPNDEEDSLMSRRIGGQSMSI